MKPNDEGGARTVTFVRGDDQLAALAHLHAKAALVPASDHLADARLVCERLLSGVLG